MGQTNQHLTQYKAFTFLSMAYITFILAADVLIYKMVEIGPFTMTVGSFVTPFWFLTADILAEVYGYRLTRKVIWFGIACGFLFSVICIYLINLPSPITWHYQSAYDQVLGKMPRIFIGSVAGIIIGAFINIYLITKWKILVNGKYFWFRSIGSSAMGQLVFTGVTLTSDLIGIFSFNDIFHLILTSFGLKLLMTPLLAIPSTIIVYYLKKLEGVDVYDYSINFNPFILTSKQK